MGLGSASAQKKAAKKGQGQAGIDVAKAYGAARGEFEPYSQVGRGALARLGALQGIEGFRTPSDIALREHLANRPTLGGAGRVKAGGLESFIGMGPAGAQVKKQGDLLAEADMGGAIGRGGKVGPLKDIMAKKKKRGVQQAQNEAAKQVEYQTALEAWNAKTAELTKQRDFELQSYDPTAELRKTPGYQFRYDTGLGAVGSNQAARSGTLGGRALKELTQYGQGFGSNEYQNEVARLSGLAGIGQNAATSLGNISVGQGSALAGLAMQGAKTDADYYGDLNSVTQSSLGNYLAYQQRQKKQQSQSPYATSYGGNTYSSPGTANQFSSQDQFMND